MPLEVRMIPRIDAQGEALCAWWFYGELVAFRCANGHSTVLRNRIDHDGTVHGPIACSPMNVTCAAVARDVRLMGWRTV